MASKGSKVANVAKAANMAKNTGTAARVVGGTAAAGAAGKTAVDKVGPKKETSSDAATNQKAV